MSDDKLQRFKDKIDTSFAEYNALLIKYATEKNATERMLIKRIKFLTNNHQLFRRKSNVFIGIYFSNEFLSDPHPDLIELDKYLKMKITTLPVSTSIKLVNTLNIFSFENGFKKKSIVRFNTDSFKNSKMLQIWKTYSRWEKNPITYSKERVVLSDVLPYETPVTFSNRYFYKYLLKSLKSNSSSDYKNKQNKAYSEIESILFGVKEKLNLSILI